MGTANVILYAKWNRNQGIPVIYNGNGNTNGTVPLDRNFYTQGSTVIVLDNTGSLWKTSYVFAGWNTKTDGTGTDYVAGARFIMGATKVMILYAKWNRNQGILHFRKTCSGCIKRINNPKSLCDQS
jgi:hypothetical protein